MSLFSFFRKNKQEAPDDGASYPRAKDEPNPKRTRARRKSAMDDDAADPVLPEKKRARRRLIGAVALVLAAVIGLPMVLDSEPKPLAQDIDIRIPSKDHAAQPRRLPAAEALDPDEQILAPVDAVAEPADPASASRAPAAVTADARPASLPASAARASVTEPKVAEPKVAEPKAIEAKASPRNEAKEVSKPEAQPVARPVVKTFAEEAREAARAKAILEGKTTPAAGEAPADKKPGSYMIQVAALSSQDKITELRNKLKTAGIASQTQKVPTANGERTRVRVGPFASKEDAEKTRAKLVKLGLNGSLVPLGG